jgi:hypothetical protein
MNALLRLASTLDSFQFYLESDEIYNLYEDLSKVIVSEDKDYLIKTAELLDRYGRPLQRQAPPRPQVPRPTSLPDYARMPMRNLGQASYIDAFLTNGVMDAKKVQNFINNSSKADPDTLYKLYLQNEKNPNYQKLAEKFDTAYKELDTFVNDKRLSPSARKLIQNAQSQLVAQKGIVLNKYIVANPSLFNKELVNKANKVLYSPGPITNSPASNEVRKKVFQNPKLNPQLAAELELAGARFDQRTGELIESSAETMGKAFDKLGPTSPVSRGGKAGQMGNKAVQMGQKAAQLAAKAKNSPAAGSIVNALGKMSQTFKFIAPLTKVLPFIGFALAIPDFVKLCNKINQNGWESIWNDPYDRAKAIGVISNTVAAAVSIAPGPLTPVAAALTAIGMGSDIGADLAVKGADIAEGGELKLFGRTLKKKSKERQQQEALEAGLNAKNIDPLVQAALNDSKSLFMSGLRTPDVMNNQRMKATYPWLGSGDARDTQFKLQVPILRKSLRPGTTPQGQSAQTQSGKPQQQAPGPYLNKPPYSGPANQQGQPANQQGQPAYNNAQQRQQQMPVLNNYNDLLYKAYQDVTQTTNVTLENLKNYRQQIIYKIQALSRFYPNINAQQAIVALDNRIRRFSGQAQPT